MLLYFIKKALPIVSRQGFSVFTTALQMGWGYD